MEDQPRWAARILECVAFQCPVPNVVHKLIEIAADPSKWLSARQLFSELRQLILEIERAPEKFEPYIGDVLGLAENVAKTVYNAAQGSAPYDEDCSWWLPRNVRHIIENSEHKIDAEKLLSVLFLLERK
jgi:hypothetical protein